MPGYIPDDIVERIKSESDIVAIISGFVNLKKAGKDYRGLCPFHQEKTPSFFVIPNKGFYHCFGCGAGGNVINFIMQHERLEYPEALRFLAQKAGIVIPEVKGKRSDSDALFEAMSLADTYFKKSLANPDTGEIARAYLDSRGIIKSTRDQFSIGFAPSGWDGLLKLASAKGIQSAILERVGLVIKKEGYYDRFRNRLMIPIRNLSGRIVGFGGRVLPGDKSEAKYINSPETEIYKKGNILFGFDVSKDHIREKNEAVVVEGYFDLIALFQCGIKNVVAVSGTGFTSDQAALLGRFCERVVLLYDPDSAGIRAAFRACGVMYNAGIEPRLVRLTKGFDPDTFVREKGRESLIRVIEEASNVVEFIRSGMIGNFSQQTLAKQQKIVDSLLECVSPIEDNRKRQFLIQTMMRRFDIPGGMIDGVPSQKTSSKQAIDKGKPSGKELAEIQLLKFLLENPDFIAKSIDVVDESVFINDANAKIFELIRQAVIAGENVNIADLFDRIDNEDLRRLLSRIATTEMGKGSAESLYKDYIKPFKITSIKKEREKLYMGPESPADLERIKLLTRELEKLELENSKAKGGNE